MAKLRITKQIHTIAWTCFLMPKIIEKLEMCGKAWRIKSCHTDDKSSKEAWLGSHDIFLHAQQWTWEIFRHGMPLTEVNNAVERGPPFLTPMMVVTSDAIH